MIRSGKGIYFAMLPDYSNKNFPLFRDFWIYDRQNFLGSNSLIGTLENVAPVLSNTD